MALDPAWIALIGTVCGGVGLKVTEYWLGRSKVKIDDAAQIRGELRLEITSQREEIKALEIERDKWREEYYKLYKDYIAVQTDLKIALEKIKDEANGPPEIPPLQEP
jgi:hypothetical protein